MTKQALQLQESLRVTVCYPEQPQCTLQDHAGIGQHVFAQQTHPLAMRAHAGFFQQKRIKACVWLLAMTACVAQNFVTPTVFPVTHDCCKIEAAHIPS